MAAQNLKIMAGSAVYRCGRGGGNRVQCPINQRDDPAEREETMNRNTTRDYPLEHTGTRDIVIRTGSGTPKATVTLVAWSVTPGRRYDWGIDEEDNAFEVGRNGWRPATTRFVQREWYSWKNHLGKLEMYFIVDRTGKTVIVREATTGRVYQREIVQYCGVETFHPDERGRDCPIIFADYQVETPAATGGAA